ncbi:MAG: peptide-methionine (R)-S-oxide reductase MsrB [Syntrophobacteraceae bacterium]|jgi:methionine-R-sulfoxide reductase
MRGWSIKEGWRKYGLIALSAVIAAFPLRLGLVEIAHGADRQAGDYSRPSDEDLKKTLSPLQYKVVRGKSAEPPFKNEYWNNERKGIYVDIVSGEPLFSSLDKFHSGSGRPSFTMPLEPDNIVEKREWSWFIKRTEVRSSLGDSHLGYVFDDGPEPTGKRYSVNSAALRFIPAEDLLKTGYGMYLSIFSCGKNKAAC